MSLKSLSSLPLVLLALLPTCAAGGQLGQIRPRQEPLPQLAVTSDFPAGNADVLHIDQRLRRIRLQPEKHPGLGWDCWWYAKVTGIRPGEWLTLEVGRGPWATPTQAAVSTDQENWHPTAPGRRHDGRITYRIPVNAPTAWFAWGPPFTLEDARRLILHAERQSIGVESWVLAKTREGRDVPAVRFVSRETPGGTHGIWVQARQHAWESGSSWVSRGFVEWLVSEDERAQSLRNKATIVVVPIMDVDNVERGAGGKDQTPHDHNRDWSDPPHFPEVAAAMRNIQRMDRQRQFDVFVDLHNPGANDLRPFYFTPPASLLVGPGQRNLERFVAASRAEMNGPLPLADRQRESGPGYDARWQAISKNWVTRHTREHVVAATLETSWNTPHSTTVGYRRVGQQLGLALERYLRESPRQGD